MRDTIERDAPLDPQELETLATVALRYVHTSAALLGYAVHLSRRPH